MWLPSHAVDVVVSGSRLERRTVVGESPVVESVVCALTMSRVARGSWNLV